MEIYKPLTPTFRKEIITSVDDKIAELLECESNAFVHAQLIAWEATKTIFRALPDGYPVPIERRN